MADTRFLRSVDLFAPLPDEDLTLIASSLQERRFRQGQVIFRQGEPGDSMYIVLDGRVRIATTDPQGEQRVLSFLDPGALFGELALLTNEARSTDAHAVTDVTLLELRRAEFEQLSASRPLVLRQMMRLLAERQVATNARLVQQATADETSGEGQGRVFAVYSSKGGAGKTTLAANLAVALATQYPEQVALLDLALTFGDVPLVLDLEPRVSLANMDAGSLAQLDRDSLYRQLAMHPSTLRVLPGALRPEQGEEVTVEHVQQALALLKRFFAYVVVDTSSTFADTNLAALEAAERVLFLVTPELTALRAAIDCQRIFAEVIHLPPDRVLYVLNQLYGFRALGRGDFEQAFKRSVDAEVPHGGDVPIQAALRGQAFVTTQPGTPIARAVDDLARTLTGAPKRTQTGFFGRR